MRSSAAPGAFARTQNKDRSSSPTSPATALRSRRKFLRYYPGGFVDADYLALERGYKWTAHERWIETLGEREFQSLLKKKDFTSISRRAVLIESRTNLLFSFEKMALRDAVKTHRGAKDFATGLWSFLYGDLPLSKRFDNWVQILAGLPRPQTRVLTWPVATVFGFIAQPRVHFFFKPMVTRRAASNYGYDLQYQSRPDWITYSGILRFARHVGADIRDLRPRDMIDLQSFLWVQGSDEYP